MTLVAWLLRLNGFILMTAIVTVFMPTETMMSNHAWLGLGEMPQGSIVEYLTRSLSALYAVHGTLTCVVSFMLPKCVALVPWIAGLHILFGGMALYIDLQSGMPAYWTAIEGPPIMFFGLVILVMSLRSIRSEGS